MKKNKLIIISSIVVILISYFGFTYFNKHVYAIWNTNTIKVSTSNSENLDKIRIYYGESVNSINRESDESLFSNMDKYILLFKDGKAYSKLPNEYGENDFLITYDNQYYFSFRQFKFNRNHQHTYQFKIEKKHNTPYILVDIKGEEAITFTREMLPISEAAKYICNTPIDRVGTIYNMIELQ